MLRTKEAGTTCGRCLGVDAKKQRLFNLPFFPFFIPFRLGTATCRKYTLYPVLIFIPCSVMRNGRPGLSLLVRFSTTFPTFLLARLALLLPVDFILPSTNMLDLHELWCRIALAFFFLLLPGVAFSLLVIIVFSIDFFKGSNSINNFNFGKFHSLVIVNGSPR